MTQYVIDTIFKHLTENNVVVIPSNKFSYLIEEFAEKYKPRPSSKYNSIIGDKKIRWVYKENPPGVRGSTYTTIVFINPDKKSMIYRTLEPAFDYGKTVGIEGVEGEN